MLKHGIHFALCLSLLVAAAQANTTEQAHQQFSSISRLLERADTTFEAGTLPESGRLYGASLRAYQQFSETHPDYAPDLVRFRMAYCRNQMLSIRQKLAQAAEAGQKPAPAPAPPPRLIRLSPEIVTALQRGDRDALQAARDQFKSESDPALALLQAAMHVQDGKLDAARDLLAQFLQNYPDEPTANYNMAQLLLREAEPDFERARAHYQRARDAGAPQDLDLEIAINF
jgi:tetratricopeptide (TPR) repeat protein